MLSAKCSFRNGFGLVDVLGALAVIVILIPSIFLGLGMSGKKAALSSRNTEEVLIMQRLEGELKNLKNGEVSAIAGWPEVEAPSFLAYSDSELFFEASTRELFDVGISDGAFDFLIRISLLENREENLPDLLKTFEIEITNPVQAAYEHREVKRFVKRITP